jgi:23S rRNA (adenine2503-C2)-methyltransferase
MNKDLKDKTPEELARIVTGLGGKPYLARYIFSFLHAKNAGAVAEITPLSKALRAELGEQGYFVSQLKTLESLSDPDGSTKFLFELGDGERIESVLLLDGSRRTLCVSTQVGCDMGCAFCATGRIKLRRSLKASEIVDEVNQVEAAVGKINNVVYMGMGEPLENYDAVLKSVRILNHSAGKNIGIRHITISTCGITPAIRKLAGEEVRPRLAISLNAPSDALRSRIMPINRNCPLAELLAAVRVYQDKTGQRVTFEYVMIDKLNDSTGHAKLLIKLLRGIPCNVNLIEYNPFPGCQLAGSRRDRIAQFATALKDAGVETVTRFKLGRHIKAACGQLQAGYAESESE